MLNCMRWTSIPTSHVILLETRLVYTTGSLVVVAVGGGGRGLAPSTVKLLRVVAAVVAELLLPRQRWWTVVAVVVAKFFPVCFRICLHSRSLRPPRLWLMNACGTWCLLRSSGYAARRDNLTCLELRFFHGTAASSCNAQYVAGLDQFARFQARCRKCFTPEFVLLGPMG